MVAPVIIAAAIKGVAEASKAGPSAAKSDSVTNSWMNSSGWTVATGRSRAKGSTQGGGAALSKSPVLMVGALAVAGVALFRKSG